MVDWEGAELCYYFNGESNAFELSDTQFAVITKILGLELTEDGIRCFADDTLKRFLQMDKNPLKYVKIKREE